jgi:hypothetical protein
VSYEVPALVAGLVVGSLVVYLALHSRMTGQVVVHSQRIAQQVFEAQKSQLEALIRQTCEARFGEWKATELAKVVAEERAGPPTGFHPVPCPLLVHWRTLSGNSSIREQPNSSPLELRP